MPTTGYSPAVALSGRIATKIGIEASLTGHLVFLALHSNGACESVERLLRQDAIEKVLGGLFDLSQARSASS